MMPTVRSLEQQLNQLATMLRIRRFEEALIELARTHDVGHFHVYVGQEPTGVPALTLLEAGDVAYTTHRNHGHLLARGADPAAMMAEILGRSTGTNRGKGGTLHLASSAHGVPTTSASVGGAIPIAVGSAFAFQALKQDRVSVCLFGDGALEEGAWHEAANIAALLKLPVIFLCENNSLGALGHAGNEYPSSTLAARVLADLAAPFGIPSAVIDGTDAPTVEETMREAIARARAGDGPTFIEAQTVRWPGNKGVWAQLVTGPTRVEYAWDTEAIPGEHRTWWDEEDGLIRSARRAIEAGASQDQILELEAAAQREMAQVVDFALNSPWPDGATAFEDIFGDTAVNAAVGARPVASGRHG